MTRWKCDVHTVKTFYIDAVDGDRARREALYMNYQNYPSEAFDDVYVEYYPIAGEGTKEPL